ncbi:MAG: response regulator [Ruminococcus sp.]|nr:response regulator [Ruminococcus sp.]MBR4622869.1 response regulator [Ruminococcus sp.]
MKVLIIDDDSMILRMAGFILKKGGHEAVAAGSGEEGISLAGESAFDMVFVDVEMPGMNGFETLEKLKAGPCGDIRVCMMSGTVTDEVRQKASQLGAVGVIGKPLDAAEVLGIING